MSTGAARETFAPIGSNLPDLAGASSMCGRNRGFRACPNPGCTRPTVFGVYATVSRPRMLCPPIRLDTSGSRIGPRKATGNGGIRTEGAMAAGGPGDLRGRAYPAHRGHLRGVEPSPQQHGSAAVVSNVVSG